MPHPEGRGKEGWLGKKHEVLTKRGLTGYLN